MGRYKNNTQVIYNKQDLIDYINKAISNGIISIDTETIGTRTDIEKPATDPLTCKLAGPCLYTPGLKSAYIPINHTDLNGERLSNQLTEEYIHDQLKLLVDNKVKVIYHNAKFDYKVLWYTCGVRVPIY